MHRLLAHLGLHLVVVLLVAHAQKLVERRDGQLRDGGAGRRAADLGEDGALVGVPLLRLDGAATRPLAKGLARRGTVHHEALRHLGGRARLEGDRVLSAALLDVVAGLRRARLQAHLDAAVLHDGGGVLAAVGALELRERLEHQDPAHAEAGADGELLVQPLDDGQLLQLLADHVHADGQAAAELVGMAHERGVHLRDEEHRHLVVRRVVVRHDDVGGGGLVSKLHERDVRGGHHAGDGRARVAGQRAGRRRDEVAEVARPVDLAHVDVGGMALRQLVDLLDQRREDAVLAGVVGKLLRLAELADQLRGGVEPLVVLGAGHGAAKVVQRHLDKVLCAVVEELGVAFLLDLAGEHEGGDLRDLVLSILQAGGDVGVDLVDLLLELGDLGLVAAVGLLELLLELVEILELRHDRRLAVPAHVGVDGAVEHVDAVAQLGAAQVQAVHGGPVLGGEARRVAEKLALRVERAERFARHDERRDLLQEHAARLADAGGGEDEHVLVCGGEDDLLAELAAVQPALRLAELVDVHRLEAERAADLLLGAQPALVAVLVAAGGGGLLVDDVVDGRLGAQGGEDDEPCDEDEQADADPGADGEPVHSEERLEVQDGGADVAAQPFRPDEEAVLGCGDHGSRIDCGGDDGHDEEEPGRSEHERHSRCCDPHALHSRSPCLPSAMVSACSLCSLHIYRCMPTFSDVHILRCVSGSFPHYPRPVVFGLVYQHSGHRK